MKERTGDVFPCEAKVGDENFGQWTDAEYRGKQIVLQT